MIGIIGGMGPYAGTYLANLIFDHTIAKKDQEHLPVVLLSDTDKIDDRTEFLLNISKVNPAHVILNNILQLESFGAKIIGISCNTAYAPEIYDIIIEGLVSRESGVTVLHIINETLDFILGLNHNIKKIGVLSTYGTYLTRLYHDPLLNKGFNVFIPDKDFQLGVIHKAIYDEKFGLKAISNPTPQAIELIMKAIKHLKENGVDLIILGCTEFSYAFSKLQIEDIFIADALTILARALIKAEAPNKLKPLVK
jgi:aspartate racemase